MRSPFENKYSTNRKLHTDTTKKASSDWAYDISTSLRRGEELNRNAIRQSISNILGVIPGERLFNLGFGTTLWSHIFNYNLTEVYRQKITDTLIRDILRWEDRITINRNEIDIKLDYDKKSVELFIPFRIKNSSMNDVWHNIIFL